MIKLTHRLSTLTILLISVTAQAQQNTTIQLPTWRTTTVQTTVSVPDGGSALLGGNSWASEGSVTRGVPLLSSIPGLNRLFTNRGIGRDVGASSMSVNARIINLEEEELRQTGVSAESLSQLGEWSPHHPAFGQTAAGRPPASMDLATAKKASFLAANVARHQRPAPAASPSTPTPSVEQVRHQNQLALEQRAAEAEEFFVKAQQAEADGKAGVARVYYQMAARRAEGDLQVAIASRLAALQPGKDAPQVAGR